jgi:hypothetical protein
MRPIAADRTELGGGAGRAAAFGFDPLSLQSTCQNRCSVEAKPCRGEASACQRAWVGAFDKPMTKEQVLAVAKPSSRID